MDSYPTTFTFDHYSKELQQKLQTGEETAKYRKIIHEAALEALNNSQEYFAIQFKGINENVKRILIKELSERFPFIGWVNEAPTQDDILEEVFNMQFDPHVDQDRLSKMMFGGFRLPALNKLPIGRRRITMLEKGTFVNVDEFVVAITPAFARKMPNMTI